MEPNDPAVPAPGSVVDIAARLALWGHRAPKGLARVEFDSDFSRQDVAADLRQRLEAANVPLHEINLPKFEPADQIVQFLLDRLASLGSGVVSITGWATAFPTDAPLIDSLRVLNYNRENLTQFSLCQIWWMTRFFADTFIRTVPDFNSWFIVSLSLTGSRTLVVEPEKSPAHFQDKARSLDIALKTSAELVLRFQQAVKAKVRPSALLTLAMPAVIAIYNFGLHQQAQALAASLLDDIVNVAISQGMLNSREDVVVDPVSAWRRLLKSEFNAPMYFGNAAFLYNVQSRVLEAEALYKEALTLAIGTMRADYPLVNFALESLAFLYRGQSRYDEAIALYKYIINELEKHPRGEGSSQVFNLTVADRYYDLADTYLSQRNFYEAEKSYRRVLSSLRQHLGVNDYQLIWVLQDLSKLYMNLGRFDEAELYKKRAAGLDAGPTVQPMPAPDESVPI